MPRTYHSDSLGLNQQDPGLAGCNKIPSGTFVHTPVDAILKVRFKRKHLKCWEGSVNKNWAVVQRRASMLSTSKRYLAQFQKQGIELDTNEALVPPNEVTHSVLIDGKNAKLLLKEGVHTVDTLKACLKIMGMPPMSPEYEKEARAICDAIVDSNTVLLKAGEGIKEGDPVYIRDLPGVVYGTIIPAQ